MKKIFVFLKFILNLIFILSEVMLITLTFNLGVGSLFDVQLININLIAIFILMIKVSIPFIIIYFALSEGKIMIDKWEWWVHIGFAIVCIGLLTYAKELEGLEGDLIIYSFLGYLFPGLLKVMLRNKLILVIALTSLFYGFIDTNIYGLIFGLVTYLMGSLDQDEVKKILNIEKFNEEKFLKEKFYVIIAIISTCFTSIFGEFILNFSKPYLDVICKYYPEPIVKGGFRLILSIIFFILIIKRAECNKSNIKNRYMNYRENDGKSKEQ